MKLGIHFADFTLPGSPQSLAPTLAETARAAEAGGASTFTLMDHWFQMESATATAQEPMLEGYTSLGFLAGQTERLNLGLLVTGATYRYPGLLAKIVTTLDVLSGGRALLGVGAAWYEREHLALGVPFPPVAERFERLEETLQICRQMWSDDDGPYQGRYYQLTETICSPKPIQQPGPKILIGGMGEAKGRDPATIEKTLISGTDPLDDVDGFLALMREYAKLGVDQIWIGPNGSDPAGWVARVTAALVPQLSDL